MSRAQARSNGRTGRRLLAFLLLCAAAATAVFSLPSLRWEGRAPEHQTQQRLRHASTAVAQALHERLLQLEGDLRSLEPALDPGTGRLRAQGAAPVALPREHFAALSLAPRRGARQVPHGTATDPPSPPPPPGGDPRAR